MLRELPKARLVPGDVVQVDGEGFSPGAVLNVVLQSDPIAMGSLRANAGGGFSGTMRIPANAPPGRHHIVVSGPNPSGGVHKVSFPVEVAAKAPRLPATGASILGLLLLAAALLTAGRVLLAIKGEIEKRRLV